MKQTHFARALWFGILGALFFTFIFNRNMNLSGGSWMWSASLLILLAAFAQPFGILRDCYCNHWNYWKQSTNRLRLSISKGLSNGKFESFSFIGKILQKNMAFSVYSAIMILKVSVYHFNVKPEVFPETLIGLLIKANVLTLNFHEK